MQIFLAKPNLRSKLKINYYKIVVPLNRKEQ